MKKLFSLILTLVLICTAFSSQVYADSADTVTSRSVETFEDGSYIVTELTVTSYARSTVKSALKTKTYYSASNDALWDATLLATFEYEYGVSCEAVAAGISYNIYSDYWEFVHKTSRCNLKVAFGTIQMLNTVNDTIYTYQITITCDEYGNCY